MGQERYLVFARDKAACAVLTKAAGENELATMII